MSANFRLLERFRRKKRRENEVPLFDADFEKLLKDDPYGTKGRKKLTKSDDEEDVIIGRIPRTYSSNDKTPNTTRNRKKNDSSDEDADRKRF